MRRTTKEDKAAIDGMGPEARVAFVFWYRAQLEELRKDALDNAKEDRERAHGEDSETAERYRATADTAEHYADQIKRILGGKTWTEEFAERVRANPPARRQRR